MTNLTNLTPEQLYQLNLPIRAKFDARQELTEAELDLHFAIGHQVLVLEARQRIRERQERDELLAKRYA